LPQFKNSFFEKSKNGTKTFSFATRAATEKRAEFCAYPPASILSGSQRLCEGVARADGGGPYPDG